MKSKISIVALCLAATAVFADDITNSEEILCSTSKIIVCFETGDCVDGLPWEYNVPQFVVIDTEKKIMSTTKASDEARSTPIRNLQRDGGTLMMQGIEDGRVFGFVIDEATGLLTVSVARDGISVSVFGACTDANN